MKKTIKCVFTKNYGISLDWDDTGNWYVQVYGEANDSPRFEHPMMTVTTDNFQHSLEVFRKIEDDLRGEYDYV